MFEVALERSEALDSASCENSDAFSSTCSAFSEAADLASSEDMEETWGESDEVDSIDGGAGARLYGVSQRSLNR